MDNHILGGLTLGLLTNSNEHRKMQYAGIFNRARLAHHPSTYKLT